MKILQHNAVHVTKMAVMPIYGKNTFKYFLSMNHWADFDESCMKHQRPKPLIFCSNYDPGLSWRILWQGQILQLRFL